MTRRVRHSRFDLAVLAVVAVAGIYGTVVWVQCEIHCCEVGRSWATFTTEGCYCMPWPTKEELEAR